MKTIETRSIGRRIAACSPIVLREGSQVRLIFTPFVLDNPNCPKACVDGCFVYQRKAKSGRWVPISTTSLATLRDGEGFKLTLHAQELWDLLDNVVPLYRLGGEQGIPNGRKTFVEVNASLARFVSLGEKDLAALLDSHPTDAAALFLKLLKWLGNSADQSEAVVQLAEIAPERLPSVSAVLGLVAVKEASQFWYENQDNNEESFWQDALAQRAYVLGQIFAYPIVVIAEKAYVGGKQISNRGGKEVDFLVTTESTDTVILIEIKTPHTRLLGAEYRDGVFPLSRDLSGAIAQALRYRQRVMRTFDSITAESSKRLTLGEPKCLVIAGHSSQLTSRVMLENFELHRERIKGITIITYDELFRRTERLLSLLEGATEG